MSIESALSGLSLTVHGIGPYGQLDVAVSGGSGTYKYYINGNLNKTTSSSSVTLQISCNGGVLKVVSNGMTAYELIEQGCAGQGGQSGC